MSERLRREMVAVRNSSKTMFDRVDARRPIIEQTGHDINLQMVTPERMCAYKAYRDTIPIMRRRARRSRDVCFVALVYFDSGLGRRGPLRFLHKHINEPQSHFVDVFRQRTGKIPSIPSSSSSIAKKCVTKCHAKHK